MLLCNLLCVILFFIVQNVGYLPQAHLLALGKGDLIYKYH